MSDNTDNIIVDTATRIFRDLCEPATVNDAENGVWPTALWDALDEVGADRSPGSPTISAAPAPRWPTALRYCARPAVSPCRSPLAETLMAGWLLARAGIAMPAGPMTIAPVHADGHIALGADGRLRGRARQVPFARNAGHIAVLVQRSGRMAASRHGGAGRRPPACRSATTRAWPASRATPCRSTAPSPKRSSRCRLDADMIQLPRRRGAAAADGRRA